MMSGHFTTALIAQNKSPYKGTLLFFLILSQFQDFVWFIFHYLGLEVTTPSDVFDGTLESMSVNMMYSHDLIPQVIWIAFVFLIAKTLFKSSKVGLLSVGIIISHFVLDFFSGHPHYIFGLNSDEFGLGLYKSNVYLAIGIEAIFILLSLVYFLIEEKKLGNKRSMKNQASIVGLFVFGVVFMLLIAKNSFRDIFGIPNFEIGFNTNVPILIMTYIAMTTYLYIVVSKETQNKN